MLTQFVLQSFVATALSKSSNWSWAKLKGVYESGSRQAHWLTVRPSHRQPDRPSWTNIVTRTDWGNTCTLSKYLSEPMNYHFIYSLIKHYLLIWFMDSTQQSGCISITALVSKLASVQQIVVHRWHSGSINCLNISYFTALAFLSQVRSCCQQENERNLTNVRLLHLPQQPLQWLVAAM